MQHHRPFDGFGLGLRKPHQDEFCAGQVPVDFVEIISENYLGHGGRPRRVLDEVRRHYPVAMHGVSCSLGSADGVDADYLDQLAALAARIEPLWVSDHLSWSRMNAHNSHDLLPMPLNKEALTIFADNLDQVQTRLKRPMLIENPSSYLAFPDDEMSEPEFLCELVARSGCELLLDVNNIVVSAHNHGWSAREYLDALPMDKVRQIHLAGHEPGEVAIDTHDRDVPEAVWQRYAEAKKRCGPVATMIERDGKIPPLSDLLVELDQARRIAAEVEKQAA